MQYSQDLISKSGKKISILVFESSVNPNLTIIESHGGYKGSKEKVAKDNRALIHFASGKNINYLSIDLSNNGSQANQPFSYLRFSHRVKDVETVINLVAHKYKCPIALIGSSLGGLVTLNAGVYSSKVKGIILNCAAVEANICVEASINPQEFKDWKEKNIANVWGVPMTYDFYQDLVNLNALKIIPKLHMPILWFHGTDDTVVPIAQAREAKHINPNIELIEIQGGGHRFGDKMKPGEWETKVFSFISKISLLDKSINSPPRI